MSNISRLFRWSRKVEIKDGDKVLDIVYLRLVGDSDYQEARNVALRHSKEIRIKLRNPNSVEHKSNFGDKDVLAKDEIILGIVIGEITNYRDEALLNISEKEPPVLPDNPTLEQQEEHDAVIGKIRQDRVQAIADFIEKKSEVRRTELAKVENIEELKRLYIQAIVNIKCEEEFTKVFREYQVYRGVYKDESLKELAFDSFEEFQDSSPQLKTILLSAYINLELTGEELKN